MPVPSRLPGTTDSKLAYIAGSAHAPKVIKNVLTLAKAKALGAPAGKLLPHVPAPLGSMIVTFGRTGGAGYLAGSRLPAWLVKGLKSKDLLVGRCVGAVSCLHAACVARRAQSSASTLHSPLSRSCGQIPLQIHQRDGLRQAWCLSRRSLCYPASRGRCSRRRGRDCHRCARVMPQMSGCAHSRATQHA
jgi:hypothetical protein